LPDAGGDPATAVRAAFSWSYRHLDPAAARVFRLAGLHPGADLDAYAAAALTASPAVAAAGRLLGRLARAYLVHPAGPGRYGMHDLLRGYAAELAAADDGEEDCRAALTRLLDHYLHTAAAAMDTLYPAEGHHWPRVPAPDTPAPAVTDPAAARAWLDGHRAVLVAVAAHAADGWPGHATRLSATLAHYLYTTGCYAEAITIHGCARRAARRCGDQAAEAQALTRLGDVDLRQGRYPQATSHFRQALALYRAAGDQAGEARALGNLALIEAQQGRYPQAARRQRQVLALFRAIGDRAGEAVALARLGEVDLRQGRYCQASVHFQEALALFRQAGERVNEAYALASLGEVDLRQGRYPQATRHFRHALALLRQTGDRADEARALNGLGEALLGDGQTGPARTEHATALALARRTGDKDQQARACHGLGQACLAAGDPGQARRHWQHALTLYTRLGAPEADQVRASLRDLDRPPVIPHQTPR